MRTDALWTRLVEPLPRRWPGYPPDWERRRMRVYERASGRCETCGIPAGRIVLVERRWKLAGAEVHHELPICRGGGHSFANLRLLCRGCHAVRHPWNPALRRRARA